MTDPRKLIAEGLAHDAVMTAAKEAYSAFTDDQYDRAAYDRRCELARALEKALDARTEWRRDNCTALLIGYAAALDEIAKLRDELGHATAHDGDWLSKTSRAMCETMLGDRSALRDKVRELEAGLPTAWPKLSDEQRLELAWMCCRGCGSLDTSCRCWDDS